MNGALLLIIGLVYFALAYRLYGRFLERTFGTQPDRETPSHAKTDGIDYVPTRLPVLFGHHFASIAGAGPIVGPVVAAYMGWGPVVLWIMLGCVFIGAMHDFAALFLSVRDEGRSIGHVIEKQMGYSGRQIFLLFSWSALILVVAIFAILVAKTFVATPAVATASLLFIAMAPVFGFLVYKKNLPIGLGSLIFVPLLFLFVWVGTVAPLDLTKLCDVEPGTARNIWLLVLLVYVFVASTIPVWLLLQPRDYLNSYLLYAMMIIGVLGVIVARPTLQLPAFVGWTAQKPAGGTGALFPLLFVTVACGACSGFHALVSSGTTAKQIDNERHILPIGYGGMLIEGLLGMMALISVAALSKADLFAQLGKGGGGPVKAFAGGLAAFATEIGLPLEIGATFIALAISAFLLTTLDTATRLTRFTWQELFLPRAASGQDVPTLPAAKLMANPFVATIVAVAAAGYLAFSGNVMDIWPVFGASNQLLAALTLLIVTLYLFKRKANYWIALLPMLFMMCITGWALLALFKDKLGKSTPLVIATAFLLAMAVMLAAQAIQSLRGAGCEPESPEAET